LLRWGLAGIRYPLICQPAYRREWAITVSQHQALSQLGGEQKKVIEAPINVGKA
jgi:hypothetical protein